VADGSVGPAYVTDPDVAPKSDQWYTGFCGASIKSRKQNQTSGERDERSVENRGTACVRTSVEGYRCAGRRRLYPVVSTIFGKKFFAPATSPNPPTTYIVFRTFTNLIRAAASKTKTTRDECPGGGEGGHYPVAFTFELDNDRRPGRTPPVLNVAWTTVTPTDR